MTMHQFMFSLVFVAALGVAPALAQGTAKLPDGQASYAEGSTTTGTCTTQANGNQADVDFSDPLRTDERLDYLPGGPVGGAYYRVSKLRNGVLQWTNDYYVFEVDPNDPKKYYWSKYWCQGFLPNGDPFGSTLTSTGSVTY
jgi:hypothetical protein